MARPPATASITVAEAVARASMALSATLGDQGPAEARELVAAVMHQPRFWPSTAAATPLAAVDIEAIDRAVGRRVRGAPLAYAARSASFRHLTLYVDERVLIPRPETEYLIDLILATPQGRAGGVALDVGTGSGAIALALAAEGRFQRIVATDLSADAIAVARENARRVASDRSVPVEFRVGDALAPLGDLSQSVDVLVSNPPYIAFAEVPELPSSVRDWEPPPALACADDGLAVTRRIVAGAGELLRPGGLLALETDSRRASVVARMAEQGGDFGEVRVLPDLTGRERFVFATRVMAHR